MRLPRTLHGRVVLGAVVAVAIGLGMLVVVFNVLLSASLRGDVDSHLRSRAAAALSTVHVRGGRLVASEAAGDAALDGGVWVFEGTRAVERPTAAGALTRSAAALAVADGRYADTRDGGYRLHARPYYDGTRRLGAVVVAGSLAPYDRTTDLALIGSLLFAVAVLATMGAVTWVAVRGALAPVESMTDQAAAWGDHDLDRRFGSGRRPDELERLATTFDGLLDRIAASLRHEQRLSAELSHELRTPLARVAAQADLLARRPHDPAEQRAAAELTLRSTGRMTSILDTLMTAARTESRTVPGVCDAGAAARRAADAVAEEAARRAIAVTVHCPPGVSAGTDAAVAERVLAPLIDNAVRLARAAVTIDVSRKDSIVTLDVCDDGEGIPGDRLDAVFEPGLSFAGADGGPHDGAGLGLPLARRLARAAGGDVAAIACRSGARLRVTLPAG